MSSKVSVLVLVAGLALLWSSGGSRNAAPVEPQPTLSSAHAHGNLTVFILRGKDVLESGNILTLGEALEKGLAVVHETGSVNLLEVENLSADHELFLQSGDIVKGGKQDRIIADDMLVKAKSGRVPCPANCCEQSRWQPRGGEVATKFEKSTDFAVGNDIKIANATGQQAGVWDNVAKKQAALSQTLGKPVTANASPTSLQLALEDKDLRAKVADYERSLGGLATAYPDAVGAVLAVNGQVIASDVYGSKELFRKAWPKLLKSAAADAVAQQSKGAVGFADRSEAVAFLASQQASISSGAASKSNSNDGGGVSLTLTGDRNFVLGGAINGNPTPTFEPVGQPPRISDPTPNASGFAGRSGATRVGSGNASGETADVIGEVQMLGNARQQGRDTDRLNENIVGNGLSNRRDVQSTARYRGAVERLNQQLDRATAIPQPSASSGVVSFESRSGSQGNALIHRGQLKK